MFNLIFLSCFTPCGPVYLYNKISYNLQVVTNGNTQIPHSTDLVVQMPSRLRFVIKWANLFVGWVEALL